MRMEIATNLVFIRGKEATQSQRARTLKKSKQVATNFKQSGQKFNWHYQHEQNAYGPARNIM